MNETNTAARVISVLVADDDRADRILIRRAIQKTELNVKICEASSVEEGLILSEATDFDCIFLDYLMPGNDQLAGLIKLKELQPSAAIVMVTGQGSEVIATEAFKSGADDYIQKRIVAAAPIKRILENAVQRRDLRRKVAEQQEHLKNFARMLAHDLKSPIRAISKISETMVENIQAGDTEYVNEDCTFLKDAATRMLSLITTLEAYTEVDAGVNFAAVSLDAILNHVENNLRFELINKDATVIRDAPHFVFGNEDLLAQLFQNLMSNAVKFCRNSAPELTITSTETNGMVTIELRDNGIGMPPAALETIFTPFKRLHGQEEFDGTGLGLATCKKIVDRHFGSIWCESTEGKGSCFFVSLKSSDEGAATPPLLDVAS